MRPRTPCWGCESLVDLLCACCAPVVRLLLAAVVAGYLVTVKVSGDVRAPLASSMTIP